MLLSDEKLINGVLCVKNAAGEYEELTKEQLTLRLMLSYESERAANRILFEYQKMVEEVFMKKK
jgi:hypothetical protein